MKIARSLFDEMVQHAREAGSEECCGILATRDGSAVKIFRMDNAYRTPKYGYEIDGAQLYRVWKEIDDAGLDLGVIYHSHPRSEPVPSQTDINLAQWPDSVYVIVGFATTEPVVRGWTMRDGDVAETELVIE